MTQRAEAGPQGTAAPADGPDEAPDQDPDEDGNDPSDDEGWQPV